MRTTLLGSLLDVARRNVARGAERLALFEAGAVYQRGEPPHEGGPLAGDFRGEQPAPVTEPHRYAALAVGSLAERLGAAAASRPDFLALQGALEALAASLRVGGLEFAPAEEPFLHPGRSAVVSLPAEDRSGTVAARLDRRDPPAGLPRVGPRRRNRLRNRRGAAAGRLDRERGDLRGRHRVPAGAPGPGRRRRRRDRLRHRPRRDRRGRGSCSTSVALFDRYAGEQVGEGKVSLALRLEFRAPDRTLTDEEVAGARAAIEAALGEIGGTLRA